jgi:hypothetical protein
MAVETLKIVLTADNKQAIAGMNETVTSLNKVSAAGAATSGAVTKMGTSFNGLSNVVSNLPKGLGGVSNSIGGIADTLTQLVPAAGVAGIAFSVLSTAVAFAASYGLDAYNKKIAQTKKATEDAEKASQEYRKGLAKEMSQLDILFATATNDNLSRKARLEAVKQLRESYGGYLQDLTDEDILLGKGAASQLKIRDAIIETAKARAMSSAIQKDYDALIKLDDDLEKSKLDLLKANREITAFSRGVTTEDLAAKKKFAEEESRIGAERVKVNAEIQRRLDLISAKAQDPFKDPKTKPPPPPDDKNTTKLENAELERQIQIIKRLQATMGQGTIGAQKQNSDAKDLTKLKLTMDGNTALNQVKQQQIAIDDQLNARTELANQLTDRAMQSLSGVVNAMVSGQNVGQAFGDMFKRLAVDIAMAAAKAAILQGILLALPGFGAASAAAKGGQALGATLAGGAMPKAGGGGFLKILSGLLGFSKGGTVSGPQSGYPVMLHGTEHIVRPDQMKSIIASAAQMGGGGASKVIVEGRIQGQDIWLSQQRTNTFRGLTN